MEGGYLILSEVSQHFHFKLRCSAPPRRQKFFPFRKNTVRSKCFGVSQPSAPDSQSASSSSLEKELYIYVVRSTVHLYSVYRL